MPTSLPIRWLRKSKAELAFGAGELDDFGRVFRGALGVARIGLPDNVGDFSRGGLHLFVIFLRPHHALLGDPVKYSRRSEERQVKAALHVDAGFRIGIRFIRIGFVHDFHPFKRN